MELERTALIRYLPILSSIGDWSYSIYLSHALVLDSVASVITHLLPHQPPSSSSPSSAFPRSSSSATSATSTSNALSSISSTNRATTPNPSKTTRMTQKSHTLPRTKSRRSN